MAAMTDLEFDTHVQNMMAERAVAASTVTEGYEPLKIYGLYHTGLEMTPEKLATQLGHAYVNAWDVARAARPELETDRLYKGHGHGNGTKVAMYCKNERQLKRAYREALELGLPCCLVIDTRDVQLPHFTGAPVITAVGLGPVTEAQARDITKRFTMARSKKPDSASVTAIND